MCCKSKLCEVINALNCVNSLTTFQRESIINKLQTIDNLIIDKEQGEESPYYPYYSENLFVSSGDDLILELTVTQSGESSLNFINEDVFIESCSIGLDVISGKVDLSYSESFNMGGDSFDR